MNMNAIVQKVKFFLGTAHLPIITCFLSQPIPAKTMIPFLRESCFVFCLHAVERAALKEQKTRNRQQ